MQESKRQTPINLDSDSFRELGYRLVDQIVQFLEELPNKAVTSGKSSKNIRKLLGSGSLPENGSDPGEILNAATDLLFDHSLFNGHPKFLGYITSSPAPLGALADLLAAIVNANVGAHMLSPVATEIERQSVRWLASLIGYDPDCGGLLVSGGNMANFTAFLVARTAIAAPDLKVEGLGNIQERYTVYCSKNTHTWIEKAANLFGLGMNALRYIETDDQNRLQVELLQKLIIEDKVKGFKPLMVVATGGDVSTGAVDDLEEIAGICQEHSIWFHIDGAYGMPAAVVPEFANLFRGLERADSVALDPHKWLYSPLEAGCVLVRDREGLRGTFSSHPDYYHFDDEDMGTVNYYEYGLQNSRGFRALKVWMLLKQVGRVGYRDLIREDIELSRYLYQLAKSHPQLEAFSQNLSITTFRFVPAELMRKGEEREDYLNTLNQKLLDRIQKEGECFLSNAVIDGKYYLRGCIVNFRTGKKDIEEIIAIVVKKGIQVYQQMAEQMPGD